MRLLFAKYLMVLGKSTFLDGIGMTLPLKEIKMVDGTTFSKL
jgi:hypothetical protein